MDAISAVLRKPMTNKFDPYDILGTIVPGTLLLGWAAVCFPKLCSGATQVNFPDAFTVIVLTALAVFLGQLVQAVASLCEPALFKSWGGRPSDTALEKGIEGYFPADSAKRIREKLDAAIGQDSQEHSLFLYAMQLSDGQDVGRARRFNTLYAYHRALLVLVILCGLMLIAAMFWGFALPWTVPQKLAAGGVFVVLIWLIWHRAWQRACYYVREVLLTAERIIDDRKREKEKGEK